MGRPGSLLLALIITLVLAASFACGGGNSTPLVATPAQVLIAPADHVSLDVGQTLAFVANALNNKNDVVNVPIAFQSSNPAVVTIANSGLACAGSWDSLLAPVVCTPGPVGVAQITATAGGVSSSPVTVYVHQHVDSVTIEPVVPPAPSCLTKDLTFDYAARAFSRGNDISATVGPFTWTAVQAPVVKLDTTVSGLAINQVQATAAIPGHTQISASVAGVNSQPMDFTTCLVRSISLAVEGTGGTSFTISSGSKTITPTVVDSLGATITGVNLTWSSSDPAVLALNASGSATVGQPGGASIIGSCTPPNCNFGVPTVPIYPEQVITGLVTGKTKSTTAWVASTGCQNQIGCISTLVPITVPDNTVHDGANLPSTPNSLVFDRQGNAAYLGSSHALMIFSASGNAIIQAAGVTGKVLAISPDGKKVIVSDTSSTPNLVFIFDTTTGTSVTYTITGATAADFSPDNLKAYIVAGSKLYVHSALDALQSIDLAAPANDVSFLSDGAFAYIAGGSPSAVTVRATCTNQVADTVSTPVAPAFIKGLPNATQVLAVDSPGIDVINVDTAPVGCPPVVTDTVLQSINLGQGAFTPKQFLLSSDGTRAYILTSNLASVLVYDTSGSSTSIQLAGNAVPIQASLTPDGTLLYVAGSDGTVHVLNPSVGGDTAQISFPTNLCSNVDFTCKPDLIAIRP